MSKLKDLTWQVKTSFNHASHRDGKKLTQVNTHIEITAKTLCFLYNQSARKQQAKMQNNKTIYSKVTNPQQ